MKLKETYQLDVNFNFPSTNPREGDAEMKSTLVGRKDIRSHRDENLQEGHPHDIPKVLLADKMDTTEVPRLCVRVINVIHNGESP